jgi:beta-glucosidase
MRTRLALLAIAAAVLALGFVGPGGARPQACAWMNTSLTPDQRAQLLLGAMTIDDKVKLIYQNDTIWTYYGVAGHVVGNATLCLPDLVLNDAGQGVGDQMQAATAYPAPISQTSSWDRAAQTRMGDRLGWEAWHKGVNVQLAPGMDITRAPMNGRNWEYMGEDPYLSGQTAAAWILGLQSEHVVATMKHYVLNDQETNRNTESSNVDSRTMQEIYLPGWENAIKQGHVGSVMCSYNKASIDQGPSNWVCQNPTLLTTYLKQELGFDGWVMSDWGAANHPTTPGWVDDLLAGMDQDMDATAQTSFRDAVKTAAQSDPATMARLNDAVTRILRSMFRIGLFDFPTPAQPGAAATDTQTAESLNVARDTAEAGTVLLKNQGGVLPLQAPLKRIALIGQAAGAGAQFVYNGGGSGHIPEVGNKQPPELVTPLQALQQRAVLANDVLGYVDGTSTQDAVALATASDYAVVYANDISGEGTDRPSLDLDQNSGVCSGLVCSYQSSQQNELISAVAAANPNTIVVLNTAGPVLMPWKNQVKAIVEAWYPGQEDGNAIAPILFGDVNPSGKLPQTFPNNDNELPKPTTALDIPYTEGLLVGYRWYDTNNVTPLFCFGHGLSYTTFGYSGLSVTLTAGGGANVSFTLTNTGSRAGAEVPQVYVGFPAAAGEPPKQLKGYQKVFLGAGASQPVTIALDRRAFSYWTPGGWAVAPGTYKLMVGSSSCDIRQSADLSLAPTAVKLISFSAVRHDTSVVVRWRTGSETGLAGFRLYRGRTPVGGLVAAKGGVRGASYRVVDRSGSAGRYRLQAVGSDGSRTWLLR